MAHEVIMPKAGMSMERGTILKWLKQEGDEVTVGEPILEIETDKVAMEVEAEVSGILLRIARQEGEEVLVTETIGYIGERGEEIPSGSPAGGGSDGIERATTGNTSSADPAPVPPAAGRGTDGRTAATPLARTLAAKEGVDLNSVTPSGRSGEIKARDVLAAVSGGRVNVTPLARRIAEMKGIDLAQIKGSGRSGKIRKQDVLEQVRTGGRGIEEASAATAGVRTPMSIIRRTIARRMEESHSSIPPVTLNTVIDATELLELKKKIAVQAQTRYSVNDFILRAVSLALQHHPALMQQISGEDILLPSSFSLGVAVSVDDLLLVPVIRNTESLSFANLAAQAHELIERARNGALKPDDLVGATFTVTNLGMYGISDFTPIINPPESAILGVGAVRDALELRSGEVVNRKKITLSLTIDHRIVDGAAGARFLADLREFLEQPLRLLA